jgi:hypothetical protein
MINPLRRLLYESFVEPFVRFGRFIIYKSADAVHLLSPADPSLKVGRRLLRRWEND